MLHAKQIEFNHPTTRRKTKNRSSTTTIFRRSNKKFRKGINLWKKIQKDFKSI